MILEREKTLFALIQVPGEPESKTMKPGDKLGDWTIKEITFETVTFKHESAQDHILRIR